MMGIVSAAGRPEQTSWLAVGRDAPHRALPFPADRRSLHIFGDFFTFGLAAYIGNRRNTLQLSVLTVMDWAML
jgi:hypothetical protein